MAKFSSSILNFGPWLTPYWIEINNKYVICSKNNGFFNLYLATSKISLKKDNITDCAIIDNLFWCDIKIVTSSGQNVILKHFSMSDAEEILNLIHL